MLEKTNQFNASVCKRKPGWEVKVITYDTNQIITLEIPKSYALIQYCSTELEMELDLRPKESLGMFVGRGLLDKSGDEYINYGQVKGCCVRDGVAYCTVVFRLLPDGSAITNMEFPMEDLLDFEVSLLQFTLGLGVGVVHANADRRVTAFRSVLENMDVKDSHEQWEKEFGTFGLARANQTVLDPFLEPVEISLEKILGNYPVLARYTATVENKKPLVREVAKNLRVEFNVDDEGFGECNTGNPVTPARVTSSMQSQNQRRQEFRTSAIQKVIPLNHDNQQHAIKDSVEVQHQNLSVDVQQAAFSNLQVSPLSGYGSSSPASSYSKHSYHPTNAQLQKHKVTFKDGAYGKSNTQEEATAGIEMVLMQEMRYSVKTDEAYIRSYCIMMGDLMIAPFWTWRDASLLALNFEENYLPVKWTKLPELKAIDVIDMDDFWALFYSMERAAGRYYVSSYCELLARARQNLLGGFRVVGGRPGFEAMRAPVRKNIIHVLVAYLRLIVHMFVAEVLVADADPVEWMDREATMNSPMYNQHVRIQLTNLQMSDFAARTAGMRGGSGGGGSTGVVGQPKGDGEWTSRMSKELRATVPKHDGKNICLLSYTSQGCKKEKDCSFHHKKAGSPACPPLLKQWIKDTYGSYVGP